MSTSSVETAHEPLLMVQRKVYVPAVVMPVIGVDGEAALLIVALTGPAIWDQAPVRVAGVMPAMVAAPAVAQIT